MNEQYQRIAEKIAEADAIVIGASNGLSIAEGFHLFADNAWFQIHFGDFRARYGWRCILDGMFHTFTTEEEKWGFWSRLAYLECYKEPPTLLMQQLHALVAEKPAFVLTSNGEHHFEPAGFAPDQVFEMEGTFARNRCTRGCTQDTWSNREEVLRMVSTERDGHVPSALLPRCPHCGGPATVDVAEDASFFQTAAWQKKAAAYEGFLAQAHGLRLLVLELGIGWRNRLIKAPLMQLVEREPNAFYVTFNKGEIYIPDAISDRAIGVDGDLTEAIAGIYRCRHA